MRTVIICSINALMAALVIAGSYRAYHSHEILSKHVGAMHYGWHAYVAERGTVFVVRSLVIFGLITGAVLELQKCRIASYVNIGIFSAGLAALAVELLTEHGRYTDETGIAAVIFGVPLATTTLLYIVLYANELRRSKQPRTHA